ncbi:hypothetical protein LLEC1_07011 [Akanthomyces lecanii]|uniref:Uncharacterized protein n=1 Tax=Cordyceps confragosa TaxID=2714763 RepID=A0A179IAV7_CORDF|nr:hypothetical protein LLEC1_07011 [Akanthomyces lecanii]
MVAQAAGGDGRPESRPLDESDAAPTPPGARGDDAGADAEPAAKKESWQAPPAASPRNAPTVCLQVLFDVQTQLTLDIDREAQRAIRERTKNQIQTLERRVEELTSLQPYQDLQAAIEAKAVLEKENADIRQRLASVVSMLQPLIDAFSIMSSLTIITGQLPEPVAPSAEHQTKRASRETTEPDTGAHSPAGQQAAGSGKRTLHANGHAAQSDLDQQREQLRHGLAMGPERLGLGFLLDASHQVSRITGSSGSSVTAGQGAIAPSSRSSSGAISPGASSSLTHPPVPSSYDNSAFPSGYPYRGPDASADLADEASNADETIVVSSSSSGGGVSRYAAPRVAVLYIMFLVMRWQVAPTRENYERLPPWARPVRTQLLTPHPAWVDHVPFPRMREALVKGHSSGAYPFEHFFIPYTTTLTLSWPYHDTDTLLQSPHSEELMINPVFERHLRNLENWKLGEAFARALPGLADTGNVPERDLVAARAKAAMTKGAT